MSALTKTLSSASSLTFLGFNTSIVIITGHTLLSSLHNSLLNSLGRQIHMKVCILMRLMNKDWINNKLEEPTSSKKPPSFLFAKNHMTREVDLYEKAWIACVNKTPHGQYIIHLQRPAKATSWSVMFSSGCLSFNSCAMFMAFRKSLLNGSIELQTQWIWNWLYFMI